MLVFGDVALTRLVVEQDVVERLVKEGFQVLTYGASRPSFLSHVAETRPDLEACP